MLLNNACHKIAQYNRFCLHYNLVADAVYSERRLKAPFSQAYEPFLVAALIAFDMGRMMGKGSRRKYDPTADGFATRLHKNLRQVKSKLLPVIHTDILQADLEKVSPAIMEAYDVLALPSQRGLNEKGDDFHVGATKLLHFLNPEMFLMIDGNSARTLRKQFGIAYKNATQPGYSSKLYVQLLAEVRKMIEGYGADKFRSLEARTPIMRVFDKIAFAYSAFGT